MVSPEVTPTPARTVAGLQIRASPGSDVLESVWTDVARRNAEFEAVASGETYYGVSAGFDPQTGEIDYVAGIGVADGADVPDDFTTVELPGGTYAVIETTLPAMADDRQYLEGEWLTESDYERSGSPEFERYSTGFDRDDPEAVVEIYLPVVETEPTER